MDDGGTRNPPRVSKERVLETLRLKLRAPQFYPDDLYDLNKDATGAWKTTVVIYEENNDNGCENPNEPIKVVGFAKMNITQVLAQPEKEIEGNITCNTIEDGRGGGSNLGVIGSIPTLVQ
ncbi:MAG: hypothetical protein O7G88_14470 [bacterium]|nr:hypothetical protein [bacterium]